MRLPRTPELTRIARIDGIRPFDVGGRTCESLYLRVCNDDPSLAPAGHSVVQAMLATDYDWWATRGTGYGAAKDAVAESILTALEPHFEGIRGALRVTDVSSPLTYWTMARAWRGAYEGWIPDDGHLFTRIDKKLRGLEGFYMAGQWVEPGGGVPNAVLSGRQVVELICRDAQREFEVRTPRSA